jgi:hypothetical protein
VNKRRTHLPATFCGPVCRQSLTVFAIALVAVLITAAGRADGGIHLQSLMLLVITCPARWSFQRRRGGQRTCRRRRAQYDQGGTYRKRARSKALDGSGTLTEDEAQVGGLAPVGGEDDAALNTWPPAWLARNPLCKCQTLTPA